MSGYTEWAAATFKAPASAKAPATVAAVVEPEAHDVVPREFDATFADEYLALANELGVNASALTHERAVASLESTVAEMGLRVYDRPQVEAYLTKHYGAPRQRPWPGERETLATWAWRPLMKPQTATAPLPMPPTITSSALGVSGAGLAEMQSQMLQAFGGWVGRVGHAKNGDVASELRAYDKPVPMPVLLTVKAIRTKHPDARFYVSDELHEQEAAPIRDPFLMVVLGGVHMIVERWDEPNYRER